MSTENANSVDDVVDPKISDDTDQVDDLDPSEAAARERGWVSQDEWDGDAGEWVDHREFNRRGEFMQHISSQTRKIKSQEHKIDRLEEAIATLGEHNKKIREQEYNNALRDLRKAKADALHLDDHDTVVEVDEQIMDLKAAKAAADSDDTGDKRKGPTADQVALQRQIDGWVSDNPWYEKDVILRGAMDSVVSDTVARNPQLAGDFDALMDLAKKTIKKEFPHKFNSKRVRHGAIDGAPPKRGSNSKYTEKHLDTEQRKIAHTMVKAGAFESVQEYVDQLAALGELG